MNIEQARDKFFLPSILLMLLIVIITSIYGLKIIFDTSKSLAEEFLFKTSSSVNNKIEVYLYPVVNANMFFEDYLNAYQNEIKDYETLEKLGVQILNRYASIRALNIGYENGNFFMLKKNEDETLSVKTIYRDSSVPYITWKHYNHDFEIIEETSSPLDEYDPRNRPWYVGAKAKKDIFWTPVYTLFTDQDLGITVGTPIIIDNEVVGAFSFDFKLKGISDYIKNLEISDNGEAIIINNKSSIVAFTTTNDLINSDEIIRSTKVNIVDEEVIMETFQYAKKPIKQLYRFKVNGKWYYTIFTDLETIKNDFWKIGIVVPEKDFLQGYLISRTLSISVIVIVILLVFLLNYYRYSERIVKSYLRKHSERDTLTELHNRRSMMKIYDKLNTKKNHHDFPLTVILCDIDHFKRVNDVYGHNCGDFVLKEISKCMMNNTRESDLICRWGGEEFLILMRSTTIEHAVVAAENLRMILEKTIMTFEGNEISVTMSFGLATTHDKVSLEKLVNTADQRFMTQKKMVEIKSCTCRELSNFQ
ncbi:MAG: diguanylate cyclase [Clostridiales bacterium]|nr:diguanylate cyclase [Clostridiales bacterium]